jgi:hypothetical protein
MRRFALIVTLAIFASFLWSTAVFAHGTGLNNVWTTDVVELGTFRWDLQLGVSDEEYGAFWSEDGRFLENEFYATIFPDLEIGFAFNVEREVGPFTMFAKYKIFDEMVDNFPVSLAVGADNIIGTSERTSSEVIPYIVVGKNFDRLNGYVGYAHNASGEQDDSGIFGGFDYAWNDNWTIKADIYTFNDNEDNIISGGVNYDWTKHFGLNGWVSYDSVTENTIFTVELAFTGRFDDLEADV